jgi:protease IV
MLQFFKYVLATLVGLFLFFVVSFFLLLGIGSLFSSGDSAVSVSENSVLQIDLNRQIVENASNDDSFAALLQTNVSKIGLVTLKEAIANAKLDPNIKGIYLDSEYPQAGFSTLGELRLALKDFKESGKFVYSYGEVMTEKAVYLNSVADRVFLNNAGGIEFNGLFGQVTFFKGLFDKVGVKPVIFKVGEYKSAVEPYFRKDMSPENREQMTSYLTSVSNQIYGEIAEDRNMTMDQINDLLNHPVNSPEEALEKGIITDAVYLDGFEAAMRKELGVKKDDKINYISLEKYNNAKKYVESGDRNNRIAVIIGEGDIVNGETDGENIASDSWIEELRKAVKDKKVKAIVLRINSGGGSASASDIIWREIELAKKEKPVFASMGDYAASGGYYMAMACDTIVSNPTTLTGSIGIFGMLVNAQELLNNKLGITFDGVETHEHADFPSIDKEMPEVEKMMIQNNVNQGYEKFTSKAAQGRKMKIEDLKAVAGGRVWTGLQAKENGLVDLIGTLEETVKLAANRVGIKDDYQVKYYPTPKSEIDLIMEKIMNQSSVKLDEKLGMFAPYIKEMNKIAKMDKIQARLPFELKIE